MPSCDVGDVCGRANWRARRSASARRAASPSSRRASNFRMRLSSFLMRLMAAAKTDCRRLACSAVPEKLLPRGSAVPLVSRRRCRDNVRSLSRRSRRRSRRRSSPSRSISPTIGWCVFKMTSRSSWFRRLSSDLHGTDIVRPPLRVERVFCEACGRPAASLPGVSRMNTAPLARARIPGDYPSGAGEIPSGRRDHRLTPSRIALRSLRATNDACFACDRRRQ